MWGKTNAISGGDKFVEFDKMTESVKLVDDSYIYTITGTIPNCTLKAYNKTTKALAWSATVNYQSTASLILSDATHVYVISNTISKVLKTTGNRETTLAVSATTYGNYSANATHIFGNDITGTYGVYSIAKSTLTQVASVLTPGYSNIATTCDDNYVYYNADVFCKKTNILTHVVYSGAPISMGYNKKGHDSTHIYGTIGGSFCKLNKNTLVRDVVISPLNFDGVVNTLIDGEYVYNNCGSSDSSALAKYRKSDLIPIGISIGGSNLNKTSTKAYFFSNYYVYKH